jgi:hypothetical protein
MKEIEEAWWKEVHGDPDDYIPPKPSKLRESEKAKEYPPSGRKPKYKPFNLGRGYGGPQLSASKGCY